MTKRNPTSMKYQERRVTKVAFLELLEPFQQVWNGSKDLVRFEIRGAKVEISRRGGTGRQVVISIQDMEFIRESQ